MRECRASSNDNNKEGPLKDNNNAASATTTIYLRLTPFEDRLLLCGGRLVSTLTWFRGNHEVAAPHFQHRLALLLQANPWLTGQIVRRRGANYLVYDDATGSPRIAAASIFRHVPEHESPLSRNSPPEDWSSLCREHDYTLQPRYHQPLYRVTVVPCRKSPQQHFALVVSMSHLAGDGHTFYQLYQALLLSATTESINVPTNESVEVPLEEESPQKTFPVKGDDASVPALNAERVPTNQKDLEELLESRREPLLAMSYSFLLPSACGLVPGKVRGLCCASQRLEYRYFLINRDVIAQMKREASKTTATKEGGAEEMRLSLNDIVTSWYMTHSRCRHGFMAVNLRGRCGEAYTNDLAGTYLASLYYGIPRHCAAPQQIRQSLMQLKRVTGTLETETRPPPQFLLGGGAIITNWAGIAEKLVSADGITLPDGSRLEEDLHVPLYTHQADTQPANVVFAFVFRAGPDQVGMFICGSPSKVNGLRDCPFARPMT